MPKNLYEKSISIRKVYTKYLYLIEKSIGTMIFGIPVPNFLLVPTFGENSRREPYFLARSNGC